MVDAIEDGITFLNKCSQIANVEYECNTFRAGGLTLQPEHDLIEILVQHGFKYDSSIAKHTHSNFECAEYDYRKVPNKLNWRISAKEGINIDSKQNESLIEIPVATTKNNIFRLLKVQGPLRVTNINVGGTGFSRPDRKRTKIEKLIKKLCDYSWVTLDTRSAEVIMSDLHNIYKKNNCDNIDATVAIIGHPKMFNENNVNNMIKLIKLINREETKMKIVSLKDVGNNL